MAKSRKRTTEEMFCRIKKLRKKGVPAADIADIMDVGENRIYCIDNYETFEEFEAGRTKKYESWRKTPRKSHSKKAEIDKMAFVFKAVDDVKILKGQDDVENKVRDIARELAIIRSVMISMAEALGVKLKLNL